MALFYVRVALARRGAFLLDSPYPLIAWAFPELARAAGVVVMLRRRLHSDWILLAAIVPHYFIIEWAWLIPPSPQRYVLPLVGPYLLAVAIALDTLLARTRTAYGRTVVLISSTLLLLIFPACCNSTIQFAASCVRKYGPFRFVRMSSSNDSSVDSQRSALLPAALPALFTRASIRPMTEAVSRTSRARSAESAMFALIGTNLWPRKGARLRRG